MAFNAEIKSLSIKNFIENLLPEGNALDFLSTYYQISKSNPFAMIKIEDIDVLLVKRFDRELLDMHRVKRLHIIDACQALDLPVAYKYERNFGSSEHVKNIREGVSYNKIFSLAQLCAISLLAKKELLTWVCVNLILGNSDAHGKNISFFVEKDKITLAPFYDIVNISLYDSIYEQDMAMAIDDEFNINKLTPYDFSEFYKSINIHKKIFANEFKRVALNIEKTLFKQKNENIFKIDTCHKSFTQRYETDVLNRIKKLIEGGVSF